MASARCKGTTKAGGRCARRGADWCTEHAAQAPGAAPDIDRTPKNARVHDAQLVAIDSVKPYPGNARTHNLDVIRESLRANGQYRPVVVRPDWRTEAAVGLARGMYESQDFGPMPVLADALDDAGCTDAEVLAHCRGDGPHVRGCWVVDGLLGKM